MIYSSQPEINPYRTSWCAYLDTKSLYRHARTNKQNHITVVTYEMFRRVKPPELFKLSGKIRSLTDQTQKIAALKEALDVRTLQQLIPILKHPDFPSTAILAFSKGLITQAQLVTSLTFASACHLYPEGAITAIPLFTSEKQPNPLAIQLITETMQSDRYAESFLKKYGNPPPLLNEKQIREMFNLMLHLPFSERQFLIIRKEVALKCEEGEKSILHGIEKLGLNLLFNSKQFRLVVSTGVVDAFFKIKFGDKAVKSLHCFGISTIAGLRNNDLRRMRDAACTIPGSEVKLPEKLDGNYSAPGHLPEEHDRLYHRYISSCVPQEHCRLFIAIADSIDPKKEPDHDSLKTKLIDMEFPTYRLDRRANLSERAVFWITISDKCTTNLTKFKNKLLAEADDLLRAGKISDSEFFIKLMNVGKDPSLKDLESFVTAKILQAVAKSGLNLQLTDEEYQKAIAYSEIYDSSSAPLLKSLYAQYSGKPLYDLIKPSAINIQ